MVDVISVIIYVVDHSNLGIVFFSNHPPSRLVTHVLAQQASSPLSTAQHSPEKEKKKIDRKKKRKMK